MLNNTTYADVSQFRADFHPILIAISVIVCTTNCLVIILFLTQASLRSPGNYLLFSLAISDMAVGLFGIPVNITCEIVKRWSTCLSAYSVNRFIAVSTVYHILWITLEKYYAIIYPLRHKCHFDKRKVKYLSICTWLSSVLVSVIELSWLTRHQDAHVAFPEDIKRNETIYNIFIFAAVFVAPMGIMAFAYTSIFLRIIRRHSNEFLSKHMLPPRGEQARSSHVRMPQNMKSALLFFVILVVFNLAWFWWFFAIIYHNILHNTLEIGPYPVALLAACRYITSFVNPILYTFFKRDFNKALKKCANRSRLTPVPTQRWSRFAPAVCRTASQETVSIPQSSRDEGRRNEAMSSG